MDTTTLAVIAALIALTSFHAASIWYGTKDREALKVYADSLHAATAMIAEEMGEAGRIGSDIADTLERVEAGLAGIDLQPETVGHGGLDLKGTAATLLTDFITSKIHGSKTEQERAVYDHEEETYPQADSSSTSETPKSQAEV